MKEAMNAKRTSLVAQGRGALRRWTALLVCFVLLGSSCASVPATGVYTAKAETVAEQVTEWVDEPVEELTEEPAAEPAEEPTEAPTEEPTPEPMEEPTEEPTAEPTEEPTPEPTAEPIAAPTPVPAEELEEELIEEEIIEEVIIETTAEPRPETTEAPKADSDTGRTDEPSSGSEDEPTDTAEEEPAEETDGEPTGETTVLTSVSSGIPVTIVFDGAAGIPEGTTLQVREVTLPDSETVSDTELAPSAVKKRSLKSLRTAKAASAIESADGVYTASVPAEDVPLAENVSLTSWQVGEEPPEILLYRKTLDISLVDENGGEIEPAEHSAVTVSVVLPDLEPGMEIEVRHMTEAGSVLLDSSFDGEHTVTFTTDSFSFFEFSSRAQQLLSWTTDWLTNTFYGQSKSDEATHQAIEVNEDTLTEGLSVLDAFSFRSSSSLWLTLQRISDLVLGRLESIALYTVSNGRLDQLVKENITLSDVLRLNLENVTGLALVRDSGLRRASLSLPDVTLNGMMPKEATAAVRVVTDTYAGQEESLRESLPAESEDIGSIRVLGAYDISIAGNGGDYQPEPGQPIQVTISNSDLLSDQNISLLHIQDDGTREVISDFALSDGQLTFDAAGFSVYVIIETKLEETVTTSDGSTYEIQVTYKNTSGIPMEGTKLLVRELNSDSNVYENYINASAEKLGTKAENVELSKAFDIKIVDENDDSHVYEPAGDVEVSIRLIGQELNNYTNLDVLHFVEKDGFSAETFEADTFSVYEMASNANGETVQFTTDSFSVYVVIGHEGGEVVTPRVEFHFISKASGNTVIDGSEAVAVDDPYTFSNKGNENQNTQILKDGETLELIADPTNTETQFFYGWYVVNTHSISGTSDSFGVGVNKLYYTWPANPDRISFEMPISISLSGENSLTWMLDGITGSGVMDENMTAHVFLAPVYDNYHFVNFMLHAKEVSGNDGTTNLMTRKLLALGSASSVDIKISDVRSNSTDAVHRIFKGWEYKEKGNDTSYKQLYTVDYTGAELKDAGKDGVYLTIDQSSLTGEEDIDLYPIFVEARWVDFVSGISGSGASFIGSRFLLAWDRNGQEQDSLPDKDGESYFDHLEVPTRKGYTFDGWYALAAFDGTTGEITNQDTEQDVTVSYIQYGDGAYEVKTKTIQTRAIQITDGEGCIKNDVGRYTLSDGPILFQGQDGKLKFFEGMDRITLHAKWKAADSNITIVYWTENAQDESYFSSAVKTISTSELSEKLNKTINSGTSLTLEDLRSVQIDGVGILDNVYLDDVGAVPEGEEIFYDLKTEKKNDQDKSFCDQSVIISGEGSTLFNVYYSRKIFHLVFHIGHDGFISTSGEQKADNEGNWAQAFYGDEIAKSFDNGKSIGNGASRGPRDEGLATLYDNKTGKTYTSEYKLTAANVQNSYVPGPDENVYVITAKYGAYIGDQWPTPSNSRFKFDDNRSDKKMYTWSAYWNSLYCAIANSRGGSASQDSHPDINGIYNYMTKELCADRSGDNIINEGKAHHFVAYYGNENNSEANKHYYILYEAIDGTYSETEHPKETLVSGGDFDGYGLTTWTRDVLKLSVGAIHGRSFYHVSDHKVISNLNAEYQIGSELDGYELVYSCYNGTKNSDKEYEIYFFYRPKQYNLTFKYENEADVKIDTYYYMQTLIEANKYETPSKEGYQFRGWFTNEAGAGEPFDFSNETMPSASIVLYPVFEKLNYVVRIDPNGAVIDQRDSSSSSSGASTGFRADYKETIKPYDYLKRDYILTNDAEIARIKELENTFNEENDIYYYLNTQYISEEHDGNFIPNGWRNAIYLTASEIDTYWKDYLSADEAEFIKRGATKFIHKEEWMDAYFGGHDLNQLPKYRKLQGNEKQYTFMGWYQVFEDGTVATVPFDFNTPITSDLELRAMWRLDGGYYLQYNPVFVTKDKEGNDVIINGNVDQWTDPADLTKRLYADQASTHILQQPTNVTSGWTFRGWRVVRKTDEVKEINGTLYSVWVPIQLNADREGICYQPGQLFRVNSDLVSDIPLEGQGSIIHMQAYYELTEDSFRRPDVTSLILDANTAYGGGIKKGTLPDLGGLGVSSLNPTEGPTQILFGDLQSNLPLHLYRYATLPKNGNDGHQFFVNNDGYLLIGFDQRVDPTSPRDRSYIPDFAPDAVIAVQRLSEGAAPEKLYAMWEPMMYVTFKNQTNSDLTIDLSKSSQNTIHIVNIVTGEFDRQKASTTITVPANDEVKIVMPNATEDSDQITAEAKNMHLRYKMCVHGTFGGNTYGTTNTVYKPVYAGETATFSGELKRHKDGITVIYTEEKDPAVVFDVNGGVWTETSDSYVFDDHTYFIRQQDITNNKYEPSNPTYDGKMFIGWTTNKTLAEKTDFSDLPRREGNALKDEIEDQLWTFTSDPPYTQILYAVWSDVVVVTYDIRRDASNAYTWEGPDTQNTNEPYKFYRPKINNKDRIFITYAMAKGDRAPRPLDPVWSDRTFLEWIKNNDTFYNKTVGYASVEPYIYDFTQPVTENVVLYTSWIHKNNKNVFEFTVKNVIENAVVANESFEYSIKAKDVEIKKPQAGNTWYTPGGEFDSLLNVSLENNENYTIRITINREPYQSGTSHDWTGYEVLVDVLDKDNKLIKSGNLWVNKYEDQAQDDYKYTIIVTQEQKDNYNTNIKKSGTNADVLTIDPQECYFTFHSTQGNGPSNKYKDSPGSKNTNPFNQNNWKEPLTATVTFINSRKYGLTLTKQLTYLLGDEDQDFQFTLDRVADETEGTYYSYRKVKADTTIASGKLSTASDSNSFTLKHNESIVLGVPIKKAVVIKEAHAGYTTTWTTTDTDNMTLTTMGADPSKATFTLTGDAAATVINTRLMNAITVRKQLAHSNDPSAFAFTATLLNGTTPISGFTVYADAQNSSNNKTTDVNGQVAFSLAKDEMLTLTIPQSAKLVVTEAGNADFMPSAEMVDADGVPVADGDTAATSFTIPSVSVDGTITFTNTPKIYKTVKFDVNGGTWTETADKYDHVLDDLYEIEEIKIIDNDYHPANPTREGKAFIGWTTNADIAAQTDFSSTEPVTWGITNITPEAGSNVLAKIREEFLWNFNEDPPYADTLYAVWSDTVTVTFDLTREKKNIHTWTGPETQIIDRPYVFYREDDTSSTVTYTVAKGGSVERPSDPIHGSNSSYSFLGWVTLNSWINNTTGNSNQSWEKAVYIFTNPVTVPITLYTSWSAKKPQVFTFTVENQVSGDNTGNEEFEYVISIEDAAVNQDGKVITETTDNKLTVPDDVITKLKSGEQFTIVITTYWGAYGWDGQNVTIQIYDRDKNLLLGQDMYTYLNASKQVWHATSEYKYTLKVTQIAKENYTTTVAKKSGEAGVTIYESSQCLTFTSKKGSQNAFKQNENVYTPGEQKDAAVVFTNTIQKSHICKVVGTDDIEHPFTTLNDALTYIRTNRNTTYVDGTATIQMLVDYKMPVVDTVSIGEEDNITLTTAAKSGGTYNYTGSGSKATITRGFSYDGNDGNTRSMMSSTGVLTLGSIILDGAAGTYTGGKGGLIRAEGGTCTVSQNAVLQNATALSTSSTIQGGAMYIGNATLNMAGKIQNCQADAGGAIYADKNGAVLNITGSIWKNQAEKGGAIKASEGVIININSGAILSQNTATNGNGGAIYSEGTVNVTGGTFNGNTASKGAAIYMDSKGELHISGGNITGNTASTSGGGAVGLGKSSDTTFAKAYFSGSPVVYDNLQSGAQCNIALAWNSNEVINVEASGLTSAAKIGIWASNLHNAGNIFGSYADGYEQNLDAFRNDRTNDEKTGLPLRGEKAYTGKIRWPSVGATEVALTIIKQVTGAMGDQTKAFQFTVSGLIASTEYSVNYFTTADGTTWVQGNTRDLTTNGTGTLNFTLSHHQKIVITLPADSTVTIAETNENYTASYQIGTDASVQSNSCSNLTLAEDKEITFTNDLPAVAPTDYRSPIMPFVILLLAGILLGCGVCVETKKGNEGLRTLGRYISRKRKQ